MTTQKIVIHIPAAPSVALSSEEKAVEINETNRKFDVVAPVENPILHESDLVTLKQIALFTAQKIAEKATSTDEIHQCTAALEQELARINRLPSTLIGIKNPRDFLNREDRYLLDKAKKLKKEGKLRYVEMYGNVSPVGVALSES